MESILVDCGCCCCKRPFILGPSVTLPVKDLNKRGFYRHGKFAGQDFAYAKKRFKRVLNEEQHRLGRRLRQMGSPTRRAKYQHWKKSSISDVQYSTRPGYLNYAWSYYDSSTALCFVEFLPDYREDPQPLTVRFDGMFTREEIYWDIVGKAPVKGQKNSGILMHVTPTGARMDDGKLIVDSSISPWLLINRAAQDYKPWFVPASAEPKYIQMDSLQYTVAFAGEIPLGGIGFNGTYRTESGIHCDYYLECRQNQIHLKVTGDLYRLDISRSLGDMIQISRASGDRPSLYLGEYPLGANSINVDLTLLKDFVVETAATHSWVETSQWVYLPKLRFSLEEYRAAIEQSIYLVKQDMGRWGRRLFRNKSVFGYAHGRQSDDFIEAVNEAKWQAFKGSRAYPGVEYTTDNSWMNLIQMIGVAASWAISGKIGLPDAWKDSWLQYRYVGSTGMMDLTAYCDYVSKRVERFYNPWVYHKGYASYGDHSLSVQFYHRDRTLSGFAQLSKLAKAWGFYPSFYQAWDFVPYSFIVDWALPIGDRLEDLARQDYYTDRNFEFSPLLWITERFSKNYLGLSFDIFLRDCTTDFSLDLNWRERKSANAVTWVKRSVDIVALSGGLASLASSNSVMHQTVGH